MQRWFKEGVRWRERALSHENGMGKVGVGFLLIFAKSAPRDGEF